MAKSKRSTEQTQQAYRHEMGWTIDWRVDDDADHSWCDDTTEHCHEVYGCILMDRHGEHLASLWGIFDPDPADAREIEADLITEARLSIAAAILEVI